MMTASSRSNPCVRCGLWKMPRSERILHSRRTGAIPRAARAAGRVRRSSPESSRSLPLHRVAASAPWTGPRCSSADRFKQRALERSHVTVEEHERSQRNEHQHARDDAPHRAAPFRPGFCEAGRSPFRAGFFEAGHPRTGPCLHRSMAGLAEPGSEGLTGARVRGDRRALLRRARELRLLCSPRSSHRAGLQASTTRSTETRIGAARV